MRLIALFSIATLIALALETTIPQWLPVGLFVPDLVLILAVDLGLRHHQALAAVMAFVMGYATDAFSGTQLGLNALMLTLVFLIAYELSRRLVTSSSMLGAFVVFIGVILQGLGEFLFSSGWSAIGSFHRVLPWLILQAFITAALAPLVFEVLLQMKRMIGLRQQGVRD